VSWEHTLAVVFPQTAVLDQGLNEGYPDRGQTRWPNNDLPPRAEGCRKRTRQGLLLADRGPPAPSPPRAAVVQAVPTGMREVSACSRLRVLSARRRLMAKPKPKSPFTGRWRIVSMSARAHPAEGKNHTTITEWAVRSGCSTPFGITALLFG
jgi:hypothetical protein